VFNIQKQIVELHQGEQSITDYFTQLKVLWDQLQNFSPFALCTWKVFLWHQSETCKSSSKGGSDEVPYGTQWIFFSSQDLNPSNGSTPFNQQSILLVHSRRDAKVCWEFNQGWINCFSHQVTEFCYFWSHCQRKVETFVHSLWKIGSYSGQMLQISWFSSRF